MSGVVLGIFSTSEFQQQPFQAQVIAPQQGWGNLGQRGDFGSDRRDRVLVEWACCLKHQLFVTCWLQDVFPYAKESALYWVFFSSDFSNPDKTQAFIINFAQPFAKQQVILKWNYAFM